MVFATTHDGAIERRPLTDVVYGELLAEIVSGRLAAGTRLPVATIAARYDLSATPVREALNRLAWDRFVDVYSHSRTEVAEWGVSDMRERLVLLTRVVTMIAAGPDVDLPGLAECCAGVVGTDADVHTDGEPGQRGAPADVLAFLEVCRVVGAAASDRVTGQLAARFVAPLALFVAGDSPALRELDLRSGAAARCAELTAARDAAVRGDHDAVRACLDRLARLLERAFTPASTVPTV